MSSLKRVTDLFDTGREVVLDAAADPPVIVMVRKLNPIERGEAQRDGQAGRARALMMMTDEDGEIVLLRHQLRMLTLEDLILRLLGLRRDEMLRLASQDVEADPNWRDELVLLRRFDQLREDGTKISTEEQARYNELNGKYMASAEDYFQKRLRDERERLQRMGTDDLINDVVDRFREIQAGPSFMQEFEVTAMYFAIRECDAKILDGGKFDHGACTHDRLFSDRSQVRDLDTGLFEMLADALRGIDSTPQDAGN